MKTFLSTLIHLPGRPSHSISPPTQRLFPALHVADSAAGSKNRSLSFPHLQAQSQFVRPSAVREPTDRPTGQRHLKIIATAVVYPPSSFSRSLPSFPQSQGSVSECVYQEQQRQELEGGNGGGGGGGGREPAAKQVRSV